MYLFSALFVVDCSGVALGSAYSYASPTPAPVGTLVNVTCASGYAWTPAPTSDIRTANCSNGTSGGFWQIIGGSSCTGK